MDVLDVGTRSGVVAMAAAMAGARSVTAVEWDDAALEIARRNAVLNQVKLTLIKEHNHAKETYKETYEGSRIVTAANIFYQDNIIPSRL
jgi:ribosomal protein L11 methylase PrmA